MSTELVKTSSGSVLVVGGGKSLPELVERAGGAALFAWDEFFYAEHHNTHTQAAYQRRTVRATHKILWHCTNDFVFGAFDHHEVGMVEVQPGYDMAS